MCRELPVLARLTGSHRQSFNQNWNGLIAMEIAVAYAATGSLRDQVAVEKAYQ